MLSASSISRSTPLSAKASQAPASNTVTILPDKQGLNEKSYCADTQDLQQLDKSEINDAVTKVLQGYDWTLVPIASK